jgi:hypothetical protein
MREQTSLSNIYLSEIKNHLSSPPLPVIAGIFLFISGFFFFNSVIYESLLATRIAQYQLPDRIGVSAFVVHPALSDMVLLIIMMAPLISVRLNLEANVKEMSLAGSFRILLAKYLAGLSILTGIVVTTSLLPAATALVTSPDWGLIICSYGGLVLLGGTILAMRAFASSLTGYRVTATALTFGLVIIFWSIGWYSAVFPGDWRGSILDELSLANHLSSFLNGVVSLKNVAYHLGISLFFLVLTRSVAGLRRDRTRDKAERSSNRSRSILFAAVWGAVLVTVYLVVMNHDMSWSLSSSQRYGLSPQTKEIVRSMGFDIHIRAFEAQGRERSRVRNLLDLYSRESKAVTYEIIDPDARPVLARRFGITRYGQAVLSGGGRDALIGAATEEEITSALLALKQGRKKNVYFLSGHGEPEISDTGRCGLSLLVRALKHQGFEVKKLVLMRQENMPQDADLLVISSPRIVLMPKELASLQGYFDRGGKVLIALEPGADAGLKGLLEGFGVDVGSDIVTDPSSKAVGGDDTMLVVDSYGGIKELSGFSRATLFPTAGIVKAREKVPPYITVSSLARTSDTSIIRHYPGTIMPTTQAIADSPRMKGPFDIALLARAAVSEDIRSEIMVFGDADFLTNAYLNVSGNSAFILSCIGALLDESRFVGIDSGQIHEKPFLLTPVKAAAFFLISVVIIPSVVLSLIVAMRRKRRQE